MHFEDIARHDAVLLSLSMDRSEPGTRDEITLVVRDPEGDVFELCFQDCYEAHLSMNFGVIAEETLRGSTRTTSSAALDRLREAWGAGGVDLSDVQQFEIETNSTESVIRILAKSCRVTPRSSST